MATKRTNLEVQEISLCKRGANQGAKIVLAKSMESDMTEVETLQKQVADLTAERDQLKADVAKTEEPKTEDVLAKADPEIRAMLEKAQADISAANAKAEENAKALEKVQKETLEKSLDTRMSLMKTTFGAEEDRKAMLKSLVDMTPEVREAVLKAFEKAETLAAKGLEKVSGEVGDSRATGEGSAKAEIEKKAKEIVTKDGVSIQKARNIVRETDPELAAREQSEIKERK